MYTVCPTIILKGLVEQHTRKTLNDISKKLMVFEILAKGLHENRTLESDFRVSFLKKFIFFDSDISFSILVSHFINQVAKLCNIFEVCINDSFGNYIK